MDSVRERFEKLARGQCWSGQLIGFERDGEGYAAAALNEKWRLFKIIYPAGQADERERCAKVAESFKCNEDDCKPGKGGIHSRVNENLDLAAMAIRSGKTGEGGRMDRCPKCDSPAPHLHPAVQFDGEVQPCGHDYHRQVTPQNTPQRIAEAQSILALAREATHG